MAATNASLGVNPYEQLFKSTSKAQVQSGVVTNNISNALNKTMQNNTTPKIANNSILSTTMPQSQARASQAYSTQPAAQSNAPNPYAAMARGGTSQNALEKEFEANRDAWFAADAAERERLHERNEEIGNGFGWKYDAASGNWDKGGTSGIGPGIGSVNGGGSYNGGGSSGGSHNSGGANAYAPAIKQVQGIVGGKPQQVYIINGQTYLDRNGTQRLGQGDSVQTGGGWYQMGANGGVKIDDQNISESDVFNPATGEWTKVANINGVTNAPNGSLVYTKNGVFRKGGNGQPLTESEIRQVEAYGQQQKLAQEALIQARDAGVTELNQQLPGINGNYDNLAKQAYTNYALEKKAMPEQMAKLGLAGQGISETTAARLSGSYQTNLNNSEVARRAAIQQVNNDIAKLMAGAQVDIAKSKLEIQQNYTNAYERMLADDENKRRWELEFGANSENTQYDRQQTEMAKEENRALAIGEATGDFSGLLKCGYSQKTVDDMHNEWVRERQATAYSTRSAKGNVKKSAPQKEAKLDYSQMANMIESSDDPARTFKELSEKGLGSGDYEKLKKLTEELTSLTPFERDMKDIESGAIPYIEIRNNPEYANELITKHGRDKYLELVRTAYDLSGMRG